MTGWRTRWSNEHGEDGLRQKFTVIQNSTGQEITGTDELVIVLRPEGDKSAWRCLRDYALMVRRRSPQLSNDLIDRLKEIEQRNHQPRVDAS